MKVDPFMRNDQFNVIKRLVLQLVNGHSTVSDQHVIGAIESLSNEKIGNLLPETTDVQKEILSGIGNVEDKETAEQYLVELKKYIIPFKEPSDQQLKKLFPKVKKLKLPTELNYQRMTFLSYDDLGTKKRYMIVPTPKGTVGLAGTYEEVKTKQICSVCNRLTESYMFMTKKKGEIPGTYTTKGNYICRDADDCNQHVLELEKLHEFIDHMKK